MAELWGSLIALGENANKILNCEKMSFFISTRIWSEEVEIEVGNESFKVFVSELFSKGIEQGSSDLRGRREFLTRKARDILEFGSQVSMNVLEYGGGEFLFG
ncbi:hypothetical protein V6N13_147595 [Hibiscus sabdariffa]